MAITDVYVQGSVHDRIGLPNLTTLNKLPQELRQKWATFMVRLLAHEMMHVAADAAIVQWLNETHPAMEAGHWEFVTCEQTQAGVQKLVMAEIQAHNGDIAAAVDAWGMAYSELSAEWVDHVHDLIGEATPWPGDL